MPVSIEMVFKYRAIQTSYHVHKVDGLIILVESLSQ
jgi:hypothetical protein